MQDPSPDLRRPSRTGGRPHRLPHRRRGVERRRVRSRTVLFRPHGREDLSQEIFLRLYNKLGLPDLSQPFAPWMYRPPPTSA